MASSLPASHLSSLRTTHFLVCEEVGSVSEAQDSGYVAERKENEQEPFSSPLLG